MVRVLQILAIAFLFTALAPAQSPTSPPAKPFFSKQILLGAHRGGANLWPENTLFGFQQAAKTLPGVLLETDARLTSDGAVVLLHDKNVDRTTNGKGDVTTMTLAQVKALDAGYTFSTDGGKTFPHRGKGITIPTLQEVLEAIPDSHFLVELKGEPALADAAIAVIKAAHAEQRVLYASFVPPTMDRAREIAPDAAYCYDMKNGTALLMALRSPKWADYVPQADMLSLVDDMIPKYKLTPEEIRAIQAKGIKFQVHTINDPAQMKAFVEQGVDSILSDSPDLLAQSIDAVRKSAK